MLKFSKFKPHLLYIGSYDRQKSIINSIKYFSKNSQTSFNATVILNTPEIKIDEDLLFPDEIDVLHDDAHYKDHPPTRWFVEPKSKVCLFLDSDIYTLGDVNPLINLCISTKSLCGVIAWYCANEKILKNCFNKFGINYKKHTKTWVDKIEVPHYYNYGVLAVPSDLIFLIRDPLCKNIKLVNEYAIEANDHWLKSHAGQVSLSLTIEQLNVPTIDLDIVYNYPSFLPFKKSLVFFHNLNKFNPKKAILSRLQHL